MTPLEEAVTAITGLAGAVAYALGGFEQHDNPSPLRLSLEALADTTTAALAALNAIDGKTEATITELHPRPEGPTPA